MGAKRVLKDTNVVRSVLSKAKGRRLSVSKTEEDQLQPNTAPHTKIKRKRSKGSPHRQWIDNIMEDLEPIQINIAEDEKQDKKKKIVYSSYQNSAAIR